MRKPLLPVAALATALVLTAPAAATAASRGKVTHVRTHITYGGKKKDRATGVANCSNDGGGTSAYALTGWKLAGPVTSHLNASSVPAGLSGVATQLQGAFNRWHAAEPAAPTVTVASDGNVTSATRNGRFDIAFGSLGSAVAVTTTWYDSNNKVVESDTIFNKDLPWFVASSLDGGCVESVNRYDVADVATHEFGHTYGMAHVGARFNTMYPYAFTGETLKRSLASGDKSGINKLY